MRTLAIEQAVRQVAHNRNTDKFLNKDKVKRKRTIKWTIDDAFFAYDKQIEVLRRLITDDPDLEEGKFFIKEIKNKLDGYARPDAVNDIKDLTVFISLNALLLSKMRCTYCYKCCELIYKDVMAPRQWTLDRVNNGQGHNAGNVVLACLSCNVAPWMPKDLNSVNSCALSRGFKSASWCF